MIATSLVQAHQDVDDLLLNFGDPATIPGGSTSTAPQEIASRSNRMGSAPDLLLLLGTALTIGGVGTGGFARSVVAQSTPSSSRVWMDDSHGLEGVPAVEEVDAEESAITPAARIAEARDRLSLNVTQFADVMRVGRPSVYGWIREETMPRENQQLRLKELYDVAREWRDLSDIPVGKYLVMPLSDGASLLQLLREPELDRQRISRSMRQIASAIQAAEYRKRASGYRSMASVMRAHGIQEDSEEVQRQRVEDISNWG